MSFATFAAKVRARCVGAWTAARRRLRRRLDDLTDRYRPEFHYMRGPGPKWREKHGARAVHNGSE
jgi:hypothetical protein